MRPQKDAEFLEHDYDGIRELNNPMPTWWTTIFWATSVFALAYYLYYQLGPGPSIAAEYAAETAEAAAIAAARPPEVVPTSDEVFAASLKDPLLVKTGNLKFAQLCAVCHGERGEGKIGPNLTDAVWVHGDGSPRFLWKSVDEGYPALGMVAWGKILKPDELKAVVAFVGSIRNTYVPGGKAPQGPRTPAEEAALTQPAVAP